MTNEDLTRIRHEFDQIDREINERLRGRAEALTLAWCGLLELAFPGIERAVYRTIEYDDGDNGVFLHLASTPHLIYLLGDPEEHLAEDLNPTFEGAVWLELMIERVLDDYLNREHVDKVVVYVPDRRITLDGVPLGG